MGVRIWAFQDPSFFVFIFSYVSRIRWVTFFYELQVIVPSIIAFVIDVTSLHIWFEWIITHSCVLRFIIILTFAFDSSFSFHLLFFSYNNPFSSLILSLHHHYTSHYQFNLLHLSPHWHYIHIRLPPIYGSQDFLYMLHFIHEGMGYVHWVFGPSFPSFLSPYHPSLRYVLCLETTLRPWDQMSSSTTSTWTGVWDLVDI